MSEMLSPAVYLRCSENSTENPWNGLACSPAMKPSTMNLARKSSRETWRITSGFRYFSALPAMINPSRLRIRGRWSTDRIGESIPGSRDGSGYFATHDQYAFFADPDHSV